MASSEPVQAWTGPDDYLVAMARRRTARKTREPESRRTQPETPRFTLSTLPFLILFAALFVITIGLFSAAWPGSSPQPRRHDQAHELGTAPKGWFQEAQRDFHRQAR